MAGKATKWRSRTGGSQRPREAIFYAYYGLVRLRLRKQPVFEKGGVVYCKVIYRLYVLGTGLRLCMTKIQIQVANTQIL